MTDQPVDPILVRLRRMDAKLDRVIDEVADLKTSVTALEMGLADLRRDLAILAEVDAHANLHLDKIDARLTRIERRLELTEA